MGHDQPIPRKRKLAAILFADIKDYSALMQKNEAEAMDCLRHYQQVLKEKVGQFNGEIIKNYGDGSLCIFSSVVDAVRCSIEVQLSVCKEPLVPLRIGLHLGDVLFEGNDIYGNDINIASRIESMGAPGSILMSRNVYDKVRNHADLEFKSLGKFDFKNISDSIEVFAIANEGIAIPEGRPTFGKFKKKKRQKSYILTLVILATTIIFGFLFTRGFFEASESSPSDLTAGPKKIAILPLRNLNSKEENLEFYSDGITQEIIDELAQLKSLVLTAFTSSVMYKGTTKTPQVIANELNVDYLLTGTFRSYSEGDSIKLSIELVDPNLDGKRIWSDTYTERNEDAPSLQNAIAKQVAKSLNLKLSAEEEALIAELKTNSGEAFKLFQYARSELMKLTRDGFDNSIEAVENAIELDPNYSQAYTFLAWANLLGSHPNFEGHYNRSTAETLDIVNPILDKALELDPSSSDVFLVRGNKNVFTEGRLREGKYEVEKALEINSWPLVPTTYCICTVISTYVALNEIDEAKNLIALTKNVDPGSVFIAWDNANIFIKEGKFDKAAQLYEEAANIAPVSMFRSFHGWGYYHTGEYEKAQDILLDSYKISDLAIGLNVATLSNTYYKLGEFEKSDFYLEELLKRKANGEHHLELDIAAVYAARGEDERALSYMEEAMDLKIMGRGFYINLEPLFVQYYDNPRFIKIRKELQFYENYKEIKT
ncbi:MAG: adenylate/guanylate cyclase domain-containing protein [Flavobacteriaceae bacterium]|nr:adenylate/guanylate cyclase domain-containing protein [Flavobacteriaceae bacterium]